MDRRTKWRIAHPDKYKKWARARDVNRYDRARAFIHSLKDVPCADCGNRFPHWIMEFDHVPERGPKLFKINIAIASRGREQVLAEIAKCDVVCANCHKDRTFKRYGEDNQ